MKTNTNHVCRSGFVRVNSGGVYKGREVITSRIEYEYKPRRDYSVIVLTVGIVIMSLLGYAIYTL